MCGGRGVREIEIPFNFAVNLKLPFKIEVFEKYCMLRSFETF